MTVRLKKKEVVARETTAFYFEKPAGFNFTAGQYMDWKVVNPHYTDAEGNSRDLTISAAPSEPDLAFTVRIRESAFKRNLAGATVGLEMEVSGPSGRFVLPENTEIPVVFIAGGIGITPFRSMSVEATLMKSAQKITLLYANHEPEEAAYLSELLELEKRNPNFKLIATMTGKAPGWTGERGRIDEEMTQRLIPDWKSVKYYVAGPAEMVFSMNEKLLGMGISKENIKLEDFPGY